jgi:integrase
MLVTNDETLDHSLPSWGRRSRCCRRPPADTARPVTAASSEASTVTFGTYADSWLGDRHDLAFRTVELYRWLLRRHINSTFGDVPLDGITPAAVRTWHAGIAKEHPTTAAKSYRLVSSIMRTAVVDELIAKSPCQVRGAATERAPERPIATMAEVDALASATPDPLRLAVLLAAWCQLRRSEVRGLRRKDIDVAAGTLSVTETRTTTMAGATVVKVPKTRAGRRTVAIPSPTLAAVVAHLEAFTGPEPDALVVDATDRVLGIAWSRARLAAGRPDLHFHDLRHSGLTWSAATGASVAELMRRAGHASQSAALRYQHATDARDRVLADALARLAGADREAG